MSSLRRRLAPALAAGALSLLLGVPAQAADWSRPGRVSRETGAALSALHELAAGNGRLVLAHARLGPAGRDDAVIFQRSTTQGATWSRERALFRSTASDRVVIPNLAVAAAGDTVLVAWRTRGPGGGSLWVRRSPNGGVDWEPIVRVARQPGQRDIGTPALALAGDVAIVAWTDRTDGRVLYRRSTDDGASFGRERLAGRTRLSIDCAAPRIDGLVGLAAAGDTFHLAWSDAEPGGCLATRLLVRTSRDAGARFADARLASRQRTYGWPELAARKDVLLIGQQKPDGSVVLVRSADGGRRFTERLIRPGGDRALGAVDLVLPGGAVAWLVYADVAYRGSRVTSSRIRFSSSADGGRTWRRSATVVPSAARLREATNIVAVAGKAVIAFNSGPTDGSGGAIFAVHAR